MTGLLQRWIDGAPLKSARLSRRTVLGTVGLASAAVVVTTVGQSTPLLSAVNVFAPRKNAFGPQSLPVNKTAKAAGVTAAATAADWSLTIAGHGGVSRTLTLADLRRMPQTEVTLPISCVEGWSTDAHWRGVRFRDLAALVGASAHDFTVHSLAHGAYSSTILPGNFVNDPLTLVALELNGSVLDLDHGYPARLIAPARPGVLQTKWLGRLEAR